MEHRRHHESGRPGRAAAPGVGRPRSIAAGVLSLQRAAGNRAARRLLARDDAAAPTFRLLIADEGRHGLPETIVTAALTGIRAELERITKPSSEGMVKAGFDVNYVRRPPERNDDFTHSLGRNTFLIFLTSGKDPKHAIEVMWEYIPLDADQRKAAEKKFKNSLASEGGVDLGIEPNKRRRTSQSIGFVSVEAPLAEVKKSGAGAASAAAVLADVILHELGHALGHNSTLASMDHDATGIMTEKLVLGSAGAHEQQRYSSASATIIRTRLEELAKRMAPKAP